MLCKFFSHIFYALSGDTPLPYASVFFMCHKMLAQNGHLSSYVHMVNITMTTHMGKWDTEVKLQVWQKPLAILSPELWPKIHFSQFPSIRATVQNYITFVVEYFFTYRTVSGGCRCPDITVLCCTEAQDCISKLLVLSSNSQCPVPWILQE